MLSNDLLAGAVSAAKYSGLTPRAIYHFGGKGRTSRDPQGSENVFPEIGTGCSIQFNIGLDRSNCSE